MPLGNSKIAGTLLFVGGAQFIIFLIIAEAIYPGYSVSLNYISDLGPWGRPSAIIFNPSIMLLGLTVIASSYFVCKAFKNRAVPVFLAFAGLGSLLVGIFPENTVIINGIPVMHIIGALLAFIFGGISSISFYKITKGPFKYLTVILGASTLLATVLFFTTSQYNYLGLGVGGMERMITYPTLMSLIGFGGYLLGTNE